MTNQRKPGYPGAYSETDPHNADTARSMKRVVPPEEQHLENVVTRIVKEQLPGAIAEVLPDAIETALAPQVTKLEKAANLLKAQAEGMRAEANAMQVRATIPPPPQRLPDRKLGETTGQHAIVAAQAALDAASNAHAAANVATAQAAAVSVDYVKEQERAKAEAEASKAEMFKLAASILANAKTSLGRWFAAGGLVFSVLAAAAGYLSTRAANKDTAKDVAAEVSKDIPKLLADAGVTPQGTP